MNDDAVREVIWSHLSGLDFYTSGRADDMTAALRAAGMLRTPGTVEVSRENWEVICEAAKAESDHAREYSDGFSDRDFVAELIQYADRIDAALAAGADDGSS